MSALGLLAFGFVWVWFVVLFCVGLVLADVLGLLVFVDGRFCCYVMFVIDIADWVLRMTSLHGMFLWMLWIGFLG